jgi:hypothetical protein
MRIDLSDIGAEAEPEIAPMCWNRIKIYGLRR